MPSKSSAQKLCKDCGTGLTLENAYLTPDKKYFRSRCKSCYKEDGKTRRQNDPTYHKRCRERAHIRMESDPKYRGYHLWKSSKDNAAQKGLEFSISRERIEKALEKGYCEVTGVPFDLGRTKKKHAALPNAPSIDKIDPDKGYTEDNIQVVTWIYNRAKGNNTHDDVLRLAYILTGNCTNALEIEFAA